MGLLNSIKITFSRISLIFKVLLWDIVIYGVMIAICAGIMMPQFQEVFAEIGKLDVVDKLVEGIRAFINGGQDTVFADSFRAFYDAIDDALIVVKDNLLNASFLIVIAFIFLTRFLIGLRTLPTYDIVNSYMTESSNYYFMGNLTRNFAQSVKYSAMNILVGLPFDVLMFFFAYYAVGFIFTSVGILAPFLVLLFLICLFALRYTLFYFWMPLVVRGKPIVKAFSESVKLSFKHFGEIFMSMCVFILMIVSLVMLMILTTFGVGLLFAIPMASVMLSSLRFVKYYDYTKMRYYVTADNVVVPSVVEEIEAVDTEEDYEKSPEDIVGGDN